MVSNIQRHNLLSVIYMYMYPSKPKKKRKTVSSAECVRQSF